MYCLECNHYHRDSSVICERCGTPYVRDADKYFKAGMGALSNNDSERATRLLESCILVNPVHLSARFNMGLLLCLMDECDEAMKHYEAILLVDPDYPGIYTAMGQAAFGSYIQHNQAVEQQRDLMIRLLEKAIQVDPSDVDAFFSLANAYLAIGEAAKSLKCLKQAHALHPDSHAVYFTMAKALRQMGMLREAAVVAKETLRMCSPSDPFWDESRNLFIELKDMLPTS